MDPDLRAKVRRLSQSDPMQELYPKPSAIEDDGSVQIGDSMFHQEQPADLTYNGHQFGNAIKTAVIVAEEEQLQSQPLPEEPGAIRLQHTRRLLRGLSCLPVSSPSQVESGIERSSPSE